MPILNEKDRNVIVLASAIRGGIKCIRTAERRCGYLIRVELRFSVLSNGTSRALEERGLPVRTTYTKSDEITSILGMIKGLEELSPTPGGLRMVRQMNGIIEQPTTHSEVKAVLDVIEAAERRGFKSDTVTPFTPHKGLKED